MAANERQNLTDCVANKEKEHMREGEPFRGSGQSRKKGRRKGVAAEMLENKYELSWAGEGMRGRW